MTVGSLSFSSHVANKRHHSDRFPPLRGSKPAHVPGVIPHKGNLMSPQDMLLILKHKPSVHKLCYGAFIQETIQLNESVFAVPLQALGFSDEAAYTAKYVVEICGGNVDQQQFDSLKMQGESALTVIVLVVQLNKSDDTPEEMEKNAAAALMIPEKIVGWAAGEELTPFAFVTNKIEQHYFRVVPPHSRRRQRLGFGNTGADYSNQIQRMIECAQEDEHFLFALSLYKDALNESNQVFKMARFFQYLRAWLINLNLKSALLVKPLRSF